MPTPENEQTSLPPSNPNPQGTPGPGFVGRTSSTEVIHGQNGTAHPGQRPAPSIRKMRKEEVDLSASKMFESLADVDEKMDAEIGKSLVEVLEANGQYDLAAKLRTGKTDATAPKGFLPWIQRVGNHRISVTDVVVFALAGTVLWIIYEGIAYGLDLPSFGLFGSGTTEEVKTSVRTTRT